jgi:hypothetical protein
MKISRLVFIGMGLIFSMISCNTGKNINYTDVVSRMTDLKRIAQLPAEGETSGMFSSYDRKSKYDEETDSYIDWAANNDGLTPQYIRKEGENMVLAEMDGPGAIVRIWSASPKKGHVKIYIDGSETPTIDLPFIDYFNTSELPVFRYPNLVYETNARGFNNYVPITFQKSIKIVGEPEWGQYYHFNYITFPEGTDVETFKTMPTPDVKMALQKADRMLGDDVGQSIPDNSRALSEINQLTVNPGEMKNALKIKGKRAITMLKVKMGPLDEEQIAEAYRKTIISINWDDEPEPSVWSPIGDFFGSAPGFNKYKTLTMGMTDEGMYSYWYMPFAKHAEINIENTSVFPVELTIEAGHEKLHGKAAEYGRFHARWHRDVMPVREDRWPDWTVLKTQGQGRFVGMFLSVWNPKGGSCVEFGGEGQHWWGEGDEKFHVDGEKFPSTFGTGTEDYFGYAWCMPDFFEHAFHSQNYTEDNMGYQSLNRWQIIDNVPFQESFEGYMEKYFPNHWPTQYAAVAYWYLDKDGTDPHQPVPGDELFGYETPFDVYTIKNAIEAEYMVVTSNTGGRVRKDRFAHEKLFNEVSGHKFFIWFANESGESVLTTTFDFDKTGKFKVSTNIILAKVGGMFDIDLNGKTLIKGLVFHHNNEQEDTRVVELGVVEMNKGKQELTFKWVGNEPFGTRMALDYLKFEPVK